MIGSIPAPWRSNKAVSVRLGTETIARIDRLAERTSCSRGFCLKAAVQAMLPAMEENYWTQQATTYEDSMIDREFRTIMDQALHPDGSNPDSTHFWQTLQCSYNLGETSK